MTPELAAFGLTVTLACAALALVVVLVIAAELHEQRSDHEPEQTDG